MFGEIIYEKTFSGIVKKAAIEMLLLKFLSEKDMYGYELTQEFRRRSDGLFDVKEGTLYPLLYNLGEEGYISSYEEKVGVRRVHIMYHLEPSGKEKLEDLIWEYKKSIQVVDTILNQEASNE